MAKRICICPITLGTPGGGPTQATRPSIVDYLGVGGGFNTTIPTLPNGQPKFLRCMVHFVTQDLPTVASRPNVLLFPDYPFDSALSGMGSEVLADFITNVQAVDLDGQGMHLSLTGYNVNESYGSLILRILRQFEPVYPSLATFDVRDL